MRQTGIWIMKANREAVNWQNADREWLQGI